jgi:hypothetical protein
MTVRTPSTLSATATWLLGPRHGRHGSQHAEAQPLRHFVRRRQSPAQILEHHHAPGPERESGERRQRRDHDPIQLISLTGDVGLLDELDAIRHRDVDLRHVELDAHLVGDGLELRDLVAAGLQVGVRIAQGGHVLGHLVELLGRLLELLAEELPPHAKHVRVGRSPLAARELGRHLGSHLYGQFLDSSEEVRPLCQQPPHGRIVGATGAAVGLVGDRLVELRQSGGQVRDLGMPHDGRFDHVVDLTGVVAATRSRRVEERELRVDLRQVTLQCRQLGPQRAEVVEQQAPLGGNLRTVSRAQRPRQVVERLKAVADLRHVLLVLSLQHVAARQPLRLLLVHDVGQVGLRDGIDDLRHLVGIAAPQTDLHDFRLRRSADLDPARQPGNWILFFRDRRQAGDARTAEGRVEDERALDELQLRLAILVVAAVNLAGQRTGRRSHAEPGHGLVALRQQEPGCRGGGEREQQADAGGDRPAAAERVPEPLEVEAVGVDLRTVAGSRQGGSGDGHAPLGQRGQHAARA